MTSPKIKILWFCNVVFSSDSPSLTGTWLYAMANALVESKRIELYSITKSKVNHVTYSEYNTIRQWILPNERLNNKGLPSKTTIEAIKGIISEIKPDLIHIWGTESYWATLSTYGHIKGNVLLEMQGVTSAIGKYMYSGLSVYDVIKCFGPYELIRPKNSLIARKRHALKVGKYEIGAIRAHRYISTQSNWTRAHIKLINPDACVYKTRMSLREEFYKASQWDSDEMTPYSVFFVASSLRIFKGFHILLDAFSYIKRNYPQSVLNIAGAVSMGIKKAGYIRWILKKVKDLGIEDSVVWHGSLDSIELVRQLHQANVVVIPSYIESYCVSLDEALTVGVPVVAAYSGAIPELGIDNSSVLFFPPGDSIMCAENIAKIFASSELATKLSNSAYNSRSELKKPVITQLNIYDNVLFRSRSE